MQGFVSGFNFFVKQNRDKVVAQHMELAVRLTGHGGETRHALTIHCCAFPPTGRRAQEQQQGEQAAGCGVEGHE